jgi:hypothetical protein
MKTLFVVATRNVNKHVGEEYDSIVEVSSQPTDQTIQEEGNRVMDRIRGLWHEQVSAGEKDPKVSINLDAASPFNAMLINLRDRKKAEEGIVIELAYDTGEGNPIGDPEAQELLRKLDVNQKKG